MRPVPETPDSGGRYAAPAVRAQFAAARASGKRAKDAAESLGLSEGAAVAAHAGKHEHPLQALALQGSWLELLQSLQDCGPLMALTRNAGAVHEKTGVYTQVSAAGPVGLVLGGDIDLRLFLSRWHAGFAVTELRADPAQPPARSLQFFDAHGCAVHKVCTREATDLAAFDAVVRRFAQPGAVHAFAAAPGPEVPRPDAEIDAVGLRAAWAAMRDTHEFFGLIRKFGVERQQGLRLVEGRFSWRTTPQAVARLLDEAAMDALPIMVFVGSGGCIQIHTGAVRNVQPLDTPGARWINVLDAGFNLHLRSDMLANVWVVEKPTADGIVTSVEAFDPAGALMAMFFGARKPGNPELPAWRDLVSRLPRLQECPHAA
ncbi:hemin-degrading factor [Verminephrobacter aporrectodeae subsp. tuberculatae]|uniref:hemin-degrading factor n=2 Tax=Verminephrobacter aporrectodeae TaxID=1110389 RepID=UPI002238191B|nr:ChuX/HutX family heme-like substrate-binding protein [Verminephrobacter aporrectodeae]MCW5255455.1 hemin-degrading factor [Verminephrobacter aporrectodeae subsp. tuberculatae]